MGGGRRPSGWLERMLKCLPMSNAAVLEDLTRFVARPSPRTSEMAQRQKGHHARVLVMAPEVKAEVDLGCRRRRACEG